MGLFTWLSGLISGPAVQSSAPDELLPVANTGSLAEVANKEPSAIRTEGLLHWQPSGLFLNSAVGTSYHKDELVELAQNPRGKEALVYCTARLEPEHANPHDANAVVVVIEGKKVGHLSREFAKEFRGLFAQFGLPLQPTTCDAVISNGLLCDYGDYSHSVELDLQPDPTAPSYITPSYPTLVRKDPSAVFHKRPDGGYEVHVRLSKGVIEDMDDSVHNWTTDHWDTINYYVPNKVGIGLGHKLFGVPKDAHQEYFGDYDPDARILSIDGRFAVILLMPVALPDAAEVSRRVAKYAFIFEGRISPLEREQQWWSEAAYMESPAGRDGQAARDFGWLMPFLPTNISAIEPVLRQIAWGPSCLSKLSEEIRKLIRKASKAKEPCADLLLALYGTSLAKSLVQTLTFEKELPHNLAPFVDKAQLQALEMSFEQTGYLEFSTLKSSDLKWLVKEFGEPLLHRSANTLFASVCKDAINRYCWSHFGCAEDGKVSAALEAEMRAWLARQVTETWLGEDAARKWEIEAIEKSA